MSPAATGTSRSSCGSRRSSGRAWRISESQDRGKSSGSAQNASARRRVRHGQIPAVRRSGGWSVQIPLTDVATVNLSVRRVLHLSRAAAALSADQVQRARPRSGQRHPGGADQDCGAGAVPAGMRMEWVGEFGNLQDAIARLKLVVPLSLVHDRDAAVDQFRLDDRDTILAMSVIPMAIIGGVSRCSSLEFRSACRRRSASSRCSALR